MPTKYDHVEIFEETVIGGFSCVYTSLAFDSQILLPNLKNKNDLKNNPMNKHYNYKVVYNLKMNNEKVKTPVITKILKLDETWPTKEKKEKRAKLVDFVNIKNEACTNQKVKSLIDFDEECSCSIRSIAIEKSSKINLTTQFLNGKMLMFSKVSIKSFVYDLIDVFMFPDQEIREAYQKYQVDKCYLYQNLTDTDSTSIFFVFICNLNCSVREDKARKIIFEVMLKSKVFHRLDLSAEFYEQFDCRNESLKKRVGFLKLKVLINQK